MPRAGSPYGPAHQRRRKALLGPGVTCHLCGAPATELDHVPPLALHRHVEHSGCCVELPACGPCQRAQGVAILKGQHLKVEHELLDDPDGFPVDSPVWRVEWLDDLLDVPDDAAWPRLMTVPHHRAVASLGLDFEAWVAQRTGRVLRWFQRLTVRRMLEVDVEGRLVWDVVLITLARQVGKSWLLRELCAWRLHHGHHFGEPQTVVLVSMMKAQARDVFDPELQLAKHLGPSFYECREVNSEECITYREDDSRWLLATKGTGRTGGAYGRTTALGVVDEAWSVRAFTVDEGIEPSLVEAEQSQLVLTSTAHRLATSLMLDRRAAALASLGDPTPGDLLIEWSARRDVELEDRTAWRQASPHWSPKRERAIAKAVQRALAGFASDDASEPDPIEAVRAQWLNIWPPKIATSKGEELLSVAAWSALMMPNDDERQQLWVAIEDNYGDGAAVATVAAIPGGGYEVDGWLCENRDAALASAQELVAEWPTNATLLLSPSLRSSSGRAVAPSVETRYGLSLVRSLAKRGLICHDDTPELDAQLAEVRVRPMPGGGLSIVAGTRADLVRALAWAVRAADVSLPKPAIA
jgi:hypothetical protein